MGVRDKVNQEINPDLQTELSQEDSRESRIELLLIALMREMKLLRRDINNFLRSLP